MASFLEASCSSSDSDDCDYVPAEKGINDVSDEDDVSSDADLFEKKCKERCSKQQEMDSNDVKGIGTFESHSSSVDEKQRANDLWKTFLSDVEGMTGKKSLNTENGSQESASSNISSCNTSYSHSSFDSCKVSSQLNSPEKSLVEKGCHLAGKLITCEKKVKVECQKLTECHASPSNSSAEVQDAVFCNNTLVTPINLVKKRKGGLSSIIGSITDKKPKMTVLQKSIKDWKSFKKEENIEHELEKFNKGKDGYLGRQAFLERSDLRRFEIEKNARLSRVKK